MKKIVTHFAPDVDAVVSVWLIKRFMPDWKEADVVFVSAGKTFNNEPADSDPDILHVDTGLGMLDHHQTDEDTCAARRTLEFVSQTLNVEPKTKNLKGNNNKNFHNEALERLVDVVNDIDHFREVYFPNPTADFYDLGLVAVLDGLKLIYPDDHQKLVDFSLMALDGIYKNLQNKVWAEKELSTNGVIFNTPWGKGIGTETVNDEVIRIAQRQGYVISLRKDPKKGYIRIKALSNSPVDLTSCYNRYRKMDKEATWYLHAGRKMLLNGSMKNPDCRPTKLTLQEIIEVLKNTDKTDKNG